MHKIECQYKMIEMEFGVFCNEISDGSVILEVAWGLCVYTWYLCYIFMLLISISGTDKFHTIE
jgi:hypothetical protein